MAVGQKHILLDLGGVVFESSGATNEIIQWDVINQLNDRHDDALNIGENRFPDFMADYNAMTRQSLTGAQFLKGVFDTLRFNAPLVEFLQNLGEIYIVSDNYRENIAYIARRYNFAEWSAEQCYSFDLGMVKSDPAFFPALLHRFGLDAAQCVFIDDSPRKVQSAQAHGIQSFLFKNNKELFSELSSAQ